MWCRSRFGRNPTGNLQQKGNKTKLMVDQLRTHIEHAVRIWPNDAWSACWIAQLQLPGLLRSRATVWVLKDLDVSAETNKIPIGVTDLAQFPFFWLVAVSRSVWIRLSRCSRSLRLLFCGCQPGPVEGCGLSDHLMAMVCHCQDISLDSGFQGLYLCIAVTRRVASPLLDDIGAKLDAIQGAQDRVTVTTSELCDECWAET